MLSLKLFIILAFSIVSLVALSVISDKYHDPSIAKQTCQLIAHTQVWDSTTGGHVTRKFRCSATIVGEHEFLTNNHCRPLFMKNLETVVSCPSGKKYLIKGELEYASAENNIQDLHILRTEEKIITPPINLPKNKEENLSLMEKSENCYLAGYGINSQGSGGELKVAKIFNWSQSLRGSDKRNLYDTYADHGDSGGTIFCTLDGKNYLVGVPDAKMPGISYSEMELIAPALDWVNYAISPLDPKDNELFVMPSRIARLCSGVKNCSEEVKKIENLSKNVIQILQTMTLLGENNIPTWKDISKDKVASSLKEYRELEDAWRELWFKCDELR
ncbi:MAG: trypsin-like serine protease [Bacteriovoracia bacterium]